MTTEENSNVLGDYISSRRSARGLSISEAARVSGLHHSYWSKLESGQIKTPAPKYLRILAETLDVSISDLYALTDYAIPEKLPAFSPYLRAKYQLPSEAIVQLEGYMKFLRDQYGIPEDQPVFPPKANQPGANPTDTPTQDDRRAA